MLKNENFEPATRDTKEESMYPPVNGDHSEVKEIISQELITECNEAKEQNSKEKATVALDKLNHFNGPDKEYWEGEMLKIVNEK